MTVEYQTPGTKLRWSTLGEWISCAHRIDARQASAARCRALEAHASILPRVLIDAERSVATMEAALDLLKYGHQSLARPRRGFREGHTTTLTIMHHGDP